MSGLLLNNCIKTKTRFKVNKVSLHTLLRQEVYSLFAFSQYRITYKSSIVKLCHPSFTKHVSNL